MPKLLPPDPSLDQLQKQAKDLQKACRAGERTALEWFQSLHPAYEDMSIEAIPAVKFPLRDAQLAIAREYYFQDWARLKEYITWDLAVQRQDVRKIEVLLEEKPSRIDQKIMQFRRDGSTWSNAPMYFTSNNIPMVKLLLKYGAPVNSLGSKILKGDSTPAFIDFALELGFEMSERGISLGAYQGHAESVRHYILRGANIQHVHEDGSGVSLIHSAAFSKSEKRKEQYVDIVRALIQVGVDVNARTNINKRSEMGRKLVVQSDTPLHYAAAYAKREAIELLLEAGAVKDAKNALGLTPLDFAQREKREEGVLDLLR